MATAQERKQLSHAKQTSFVRLGDCIEQLDMPNTTRTALRVAFVTTAIACKSRNVLTVMLGKDARYGDTLRTVFGIMEADAVAHPDDFIAAIVNNPEVMGDGK